MNRLMLGFLALTLVTWGILLTPRVAEGRTGSWASPRAPFEFKKGTVDTGGAGQVELTLGTTGRTSYTWTVCNDGTSLILGQADVTRGTPLVAPVAVAPGSTVAMDPVFEVEGGKCIEAGDFNGTTLVLEAASVNGQAWRVFAKR